MKAFVTGGSGFIGRLLKKHVDRRCDVYALTHSDSNLVLVASTKVTPVRGDILEVESMRPASSSPSSGSALCSASHAGKMGSVFN